MSEVKKTHIDQLSEALKEVFDKVSHGEAELSHLVQDDNLLLSEEASTEVKEALASGSHGIVYGDLFHFPIPQKILETHLTQSGGVATQEEFGEETHKLLNLKVIDPMNIGYYSDVVSDIAHQEGFDFFHVRRFLVSIIEYVTYLKVSDISDFPVDVYFGFNDSCFFIRAVTPVNGFVLENITESFETESKDPYKTLLTEALQNSDLFSINHIENSEKLTLTGLWCKNPSFEKENGFPSLLVSKFNSCRDKTKEGVNNISSKVLLMKEEHDLKIKDLPGDGAENYELSDFDKTSNVVKIKRIVEFIVKSAEVEEIVDFNDTLLEKYLQLYPDQKSIEDLTEDDKKLIVDCITDDEKRDILEDNVEIVSGAVDEDDYLDSVLGSLEDLSANEATYMVRGTMEEEEESTTISGVTDDLSEDITRIGGSGEEKDDTEYRISGVTQKINDDNWKVKKSEMVAEVKGKINDLRGSADKATIDKEIGMIVRNHLGTNDEQSENFINALREDATEDILSKKELNSSVDIRNRLEIEKLKGNLKLRDAQLGKMKKMLTNLKTEVEKVRKEKDDAKQAQKVAEFEQANPKQPIEIQDHKAEIDNLQKQLRANELKNQQNNEVQKQKESEIDKLQQRIALKKGEVEQSEMTPEDAAELKRLQDELNSKEEEVNAIKEISSGNTEIEKLKKMIAAKEAEADEATERELRDQEEIEKLQEELAAKKKEIKKVESKDQSEKLEGDIATLQKKLEVKEQQAVESKQASRDALINSKNANRELETVKKQLKDKELVLERERKRFEVELSKAKAQNEKLKERNAQQVSEKSELVQAGNGDVSKENEKLKAEVEQLKKKISFMYESNKASQETATSSDASDLKDEKKKLEIELAQLMKTSSDKDGQIKALEYKLQTAQQNSSNTQVSMQKIKEAETQMRQKEREADTAKKLLKKFEDKVKELQQEIKKQEVKMKFLAAQASNQGANKAANANGKGTEANNTQLMKKLEIENKKLQMVAKKSTDELAQRKAELNKMKIEKKTLENKLRDAERKMQNLSKKKAA